MCRAVGFTGAIAKSLPESALVRETGPTIDPLRDPDFFRPAAEPRRHRSDQGIVLPPAMRLAHASRHPESL
jgi:hypothetical protein